MSLQPDSLATKTFPPNTQRAIFAAGCFWGVEHIFQRHFGHGKGLLDARVGYTGGKSTPGHHPSYGEVCTGVTGHAEALLVMFDPETVSYRQLVEFFFRIHDPTQLNGQGADIGTQYRSAIFADNEEQLKIAKDIKQKVQQQWFKNKPVTTQIAMASDWYDAEENHQKYMEKVEEHNATHARKIFAYECPLHVYRDEGNLPKLVD